MKFPKRIVVKMQDPGTSDEVLITYREGQEAQMVRMGELCTVGIYELVEARRLKGIVVMTQQGGSR